MTSPPSQDLALTLAGQGHYGRKQLFSRNPLVAFSHRARLRLARRLVRPWAGRRLLDYGCGDGTFLTLVHDLFPGAVGADIVPGQVVECASRLRPWIDAAFVTTVDLAGDAHDASYDVITCLEVLEHCPDAERAHVLRELRRLATPKATVVFSVPLETGPSLALKQLARTVAGWHLEEYRGRERYSAREFLTMLVAVERTAIERVPTEVALPGGTLRHHGHKGFNWRHMRSEIRQLFSIERTMFSPLRWLGGWLNCQAWFICRPLSGS